ncbi:hypothetical protein IPH19_05320 [Candidatus Uhrbacteria bacterium]|nr:MAG: hypothetical protein IPH19_05320 [Candidatus Uhrbacteria bacterium]
MRNIDPSLVTLLDQVRKAYESIPERFRKETTVAVLIRVIAYLVPGVVAVDGFHRPGGDPHAWLNVNGHPAYIIDLLPPEIHPGPVIVHVGKRNIYANMYVPSPHLTQECDADSEIAVNEIIGATEGARRFLSMP